MRYVLGIDLGTSGTKTVLFDEFGKAVSSSTVEYEMIQPQNGWAEQDPQEWWNAAVTTIQSVLVESKVAPEDIKGLGISGQMHGLVMVDASGEVIRNSIIWCDGRTTDECAEITEKITRERLIEITANPALTGFTAGKVLWVRKHEPENYSKCAKILLPKDYVRYKLTGWFGAEASDASGTNLYDVSKREWSQEILEILEIDENLLPPCKEAVDVAGTISVEAAELTGLSTETIVCYGAGDNAAAAVGTGVVSKGKAFTTIGTSGVIFAHSEEPMLDKEGRVHTFCSAVPGKYTVMSCTLAAGLSLKWYRDQIGNESYDEVNKQVEQLPIGSEKLLYLPYLMGERSPILDEHARACFIGLSAIHTKQHMARAVMEGVMFSQKQCLDVINGMEVFPEEMYACGGGAKSKIWRQMMADMYGTKVLLTETEEGPALGVAILAAVAAGIYPNVEVACEQIIKTKEIQSPVVEASKEYNKYYEIYCGLYGNLKNSFKALHNI